VALVCQQTFHQALAVAVAAVVRETQQELLFKLAGQACQVVATVATPIKISTLMVSTRLPQVAQAQAVVAAAVVLSN
jgi:hypothetical protein